LTNLGGGRKRRKKGRKEERKKRRKSRSRRGGVGVGAACKTDEYCDGDLVCKDQVR